MKNSCVILSACPVGPEMRACIDPKTDFVIACDAGWKNCEKFGLVPDLVVGDFDSAPQPPESRDCIILPHVKDDTDTQFAAKEAARRGFTSVRMLGALGGRRVEHTLANLGTGLWLEKQGIAASIEDERSRITYVAPGTSRRYRKGKYQYLSVFPAEGQAGGVTIEGAFYALDNAALTSAYPLGVSNEFAGNTVTVSVKSGFLVVIETIADT